jgi:predicted HicB family RNase H-like nuclease
MVSVNLRDFPEELHHKAKIQAAVEKTTLKDLIIKALTEYLERKKERRLAERQ